MGTTVGPRIEAKMDSPAMSSFARNCLALVASIAGTADAQVMARPPTLEVPYADETLCVDANPEDPAWQQAAVIPALQPSVSDKADGENDHEVSTQVRLLWRPDALHVRFVCADLELFAPHGVVRDAPHHEGDVVEVFIDGVGDGRQWFEVQLNPLGGILDQNTTMTAEPESDDRGLLTSASNRNRWVDLAYSIEGLRTAVRPVEQGWIADLAIPAAQVLRRLPDRRFEPGMKLRVNLLRYDHPLLTDGTRGFVALNWSPLLKGNPHRSPQRMGTVILIPAQE